MKLCARLAATGGSSSAQTASRRRLIRRLFVSASSQLGRAVAAHQSSLLALAGRRKVEARRGLQGERRSALLWRRAVQRAGAVKRAVSRRPVFRRRRRRWLLCQAAAARQAQVECVRGGWLRPHRLQAHHEARLGRLRACSESHRARRQRRRRRRGFKRRAVEEIARRSRGGGLRDSGPRGLLATTVAVAPTCVCAPGRLASSSSAPSLLPFAGLFVAPTAAVVLFIYFCVRAELST